MRRQQKKKKKARLTEINDQLTKLEAPYKTEPKTEVLNKITAVLYEYKFYNVKKHIKSVQVRQRHFELGDKLHRLLARHLRQILASRAIH